MRFIPENDDGIDDRLSRIEDDLDRLDRSSKSPISKLRRKRPSEVDHVDLVHRLISKIPDTLVSPKFADARYSYTAYEELPSPDVKDVSRMRQRISELDREMVNLARSNDSDIHNLQLELSRSKGRLNALKNENEALRKEINHDRSSESVEIRELRKQLHTARIQFEELQGRLFEKEQDMDILKASVSDLEKQRVQYRDNAKRLAEEVAWLKEQLREQKTSATSHLKYEIEQLKYMVDSQNRELRELRSINRVPGSISRGSARSSTFEQSAPMIISKPKPPQVSIGIEKRSVSPYPPWSLHDNMIPPKITEDPNHVSPSSSVSRQPVSAVGEECPRDPPTPQTKSTSNTSSQHGIFEVPADRLESDLLTLNLERQALESWLGKLPAYSGGRTLAERKEKFIKERRLAEVDKAISELKFRIKERKKERSHPLG